MQRVLRYNLLARNNELKKVRKKLFKERKDQEKDFDRWSKQRGSALREQVRSERRNRREDWMAGPLAPNRNSGLHKGTYGSVSSLEVSTKALPRHIIGGPKKDINAKTGIKEEWEGEGNEWNIIVGDRVCVVRGAAGTVGKIGQVQEVNPEKGELFVENLNMGDVEMPAYLNSSQRERKVNSIPLPLKFADVRLVVTLTDPETEVKRDVIVRHLRGGAPHYEREYGSNTPRHTRYIAGEDVEIEWPEPEIAEHERQIYDTARRDVEDETYVPSIFHTPLPEGVERELMDPYARSRRRHDNEWIQRKIVEDARSAWYEQRRLVTPKQEHMEKGTKDPQLESRMEKARREMWSVILEEQASVGKNLEKR